MNVNRRLLNHSLIFFLISSLCTLAGCSDKKEIAQADAVKISMVRLGEYATRNAIPITAFSDPTIRFNTELEIWEIYFQSLGIQKHHVVILVNRFGGAEITFTIDKPKKAELKSSGAIVSA